MSQPPQEDWPQGGGQEPHQQGYGQQPWPHPDPGAPGAPGTQPWGPPAQHQPLQPRSYYENSSLYGHYTSHEVGGGGRRGCVIVAVVFIVMTALGIIGMTVAFMFAIPM